VARRYAEGESFYRIAKDYGCNYQAVKNACRRQEVEFRGSPTARKLSDGQIEEVVRLYKETHVSTNELAGRFGISAATVNGYLVRRGVPIRRNSAREERHGRGGRHRDKTTGYVRVRVQPDDWLYRHSTNIKAVCGCCGSSDIGYVPLT
jgi:DNA-binding CsgD family transcriptional regulator